MPNDSVDLVPHNSGSQWSDTPANTPVAPDPGRPKKRWNSSELVILTTLRVLSLAVVVAVVAFLVGSATRSDSSSDESAVPAESVQWMTWSQSLPDGQTVVLKGALPNGYPTETYLGSELLDRDAGGDFGWNLDIRIPEPISMMEDMSCDDLLDDAYNWMGGAQDLTENGLVDASYRQLAYAGYALELREDRGCA